MAIKMLLTGAALSLPMAAQAAPVPIFESLDGYIELRPVEVGTVTFDLFDEDYIQFDSFFGVGDAGRDLVVLGPDAEEIVLRSSTILRERGTTSGPAPGAPATQGEFLLQFGDLSGPAADLFGPSAYLTISFDDPDSVSLDEDGTYFGGVIYGVDARIYATAPSPIPIPVPATLPLLAGALGIGALALRRRAA